jgi:putative SOS response-associated peptidase YedK
VLRYVAAMPGRYALAGLTGLDLVWETRVKPEFAPNFNAKPKQSLPIICNDAPDEVRLAHWSLIPPWEKTFATKDPTFNAREDWLAKGRMYGPILRQQRCLVPANGFFEWQQIQGSQKKRPLWLHVVGQPIITFAGLYSDWADPTTGEVRRSFTVITTIPNAMIAAFRDQMPVILTPDSRAAWMAPSATEPDKLMPLLRPYLGKMEAYEVSNAVNQGLDGPECIARV